MKKTFLLFMTLLFAVTAMAIDTNGEYGFMQQKSPEGYQQYIGKAFIVRPAYGSLETWDKSGFKPSEEDFNKTFVVTKITTKSVTLNDKPNTEVTVEAVEKGTKKKIKFKGYEEVSVKVNWIGSVKKWPLIGEMPIVLVDALSEYKAENVGKTITHPIVKDQYTIVDAYIGKPDKDEAATGAMRLKVKNNRTDEIKDVLESKKDTEPFADALTGKYKTSLVKVEKPEDSSNRYGETKTIQDAGVEKYSFKDDVIDIVIYGTSQEFNFVLKNISQHSLKIIWNEAAFVGLDGTSSKIMHVGVKYSEREGDQPATTIIKGAKLEDLATPTANVYYDEGVTIGYSTIGNGWKTKSMLPKDYVGKEAGEIRLMLPIQVKDVVNEYTFVFKVYYTYDHPELLNPDKI